MPQPKEEVDQKAQKIKLKQFKDASLSQKKVPQTFTMGGGL
jgi:hypothetical protein